MSDTFSVRAGLVIGCLLATGVAGADTIGPDSFGYSANTEAPYSFEDITSTGTQILSDVDDAAVSVPIGFTFDFYGAARTTAFVSSNGLVTFGSGNTAFSNTTLSAGPSQAAIAVLWDDWVTENGPDDAVYYETRGTPGVDRRLIVQWHLVAPCCLPDASGEADFQLVLFESGALEFRYEDVVGVTDADNGISATVGTRNSTASGAPGNGHVLQVSFNSAVISNGQAIRISLPLPLQYSEFFDQADTPYCPGDPQYDNWKAFSDSLPATANSITVSGSRDPTGFTCNDPALVAEIMANLRDRTAGSVFCNGLFWSAGACTNPGPCGASAADGLELAVSTNNTVCSCSTDRFSLRATISQSQFGGINGSNCSPQPQTLSVSVACTSDCPITDNQEEEEEGLGTPGDDNPDALPFVTFPWEEQPAKGKGGALPQATLAVLLLLAGLRRRRP